MVEPLSNHLIGSLQLAKMKNYPSMKLELLALKWAVAEKFLECMYLLGCEKRCEVVVYTH